jgi:hypothetical protein
MSLRKTGQESGQDQLIMPPVTEEFTVTDGSTSPAMLHELHRSSSSSRAIGKQQRFRAGLGVRGVARRTLGIFLLLVTVVLWTGSNFLASVSVRARGIPLFSADSNDRPSLQMTPTPSHISSHTSTHHSLPYLCSQYFSESPINMGIVRFSNLL